jgi:hypothetical protein
MPQLARLGPPHTKAVPIEKLHVLAIRKVKSGARSRHRRSNFADFVVHPLCAFGQERLATPQRSSPSGPDQLIR